MTDVSISNAPKGWPTHNPDGYAYFYALEPGSEINPITGMPVSVVSKDAYGNPKRSLMYDNQTFPGGVNEINDYKMRVQVRDHSTDQGTDQTVPVTHTPYGDGLYSSWQSMNTQNIHGAAAMYQSIWAEHNAGHIQGPDWMAYYSQVQMACGGPTGFHQWYNLHFSGGYAPNGEQCGPPFNGSFVFATGAWYGPQGEVITVAMPTGGGTP